ncbi:MmpS family membrane protein [Mycobacterium tuberculosis]|nr:MmpS family membrane protein [Mycobacterium tuberculosis]
MCVSRGGMLERAKFPRRLFCRNEYILFSKVSSLHATRCDSAIDAKPGLRRLIRAHLDTIHRVTPCLNRRSGLPAARGIKYIEMAQVNRPGMSGDSSSWKGWGHVRWFIEEVPAGAA